MRYGSRLAPKNSHKWLISEKTVVGIFSLGVILTFVGVVLVSVGHVSTSALIAIGAVLLGVGLFLLALSLFLCCHAYCVWYVKDAETQTMTMVAADYVDASMTPTSPAYAVIDKRPPPNGVLRDGTQVGSLSKKHVTISPRTRNDVFTEYYSGRMSDTSKLSDRSKTESSSTGKPPSSASVQRTSSSTVDAKPQLASLAYLKDPYSQTPYSSLHQKPPRAPQTVQVPIHVQTQNGYGYVSRYGDNTKMAPVRPYYTERTRAGSTASSTQFPTRRHSDDDYDNAGDMAPMLAYQSYQHSPQSFQQSSTYSYKQSEQSHPQAPPPQAQTQWKIVNQNYEEPPPAQPLVYPSARRPMTFEQLSSSKVSVYDNIHMGFREEID